MQTTKRAAKKAMGTAAEWDGIWSRYTAAVRAGEDLASHNTEVRRYHEAAGWPVPMWAW